MVGKREVVKEISVCGNFPSEVADGVYKVFVEALKRAVVAYGTVNIPEVGKFYVLTKKERVGVNPNTKERIIIPERKTVSFKPSKAFLKLIQEEGEGG